MTRTTDHEPRTTDHGPRTTNHGPRTTNHEPRTTNHFLFMKNIDKLIALALLIGALVVLACQPKTVRSEEPDANAADPLPTPKREGGREPITIAAVGDIMLGSPYPNDSRMPPNDGADLLKQVTPILSAADIAFGNLEGPMVDSGASSKCSPGIHALLCLPRAYPLWKIPQRSRFRRDEPREQSRRRFRRCGTHASTRKIAGRSRDQTCRKRSTLNIPPLSNGSG